VRYCEDVRNHRSRDFIIRSTGVVILLVVAVGCSSKDSKPGNMPKGPEGTSEESLETTTTVSTEPEIKPVSEDIKLNAGLNLEKVEQISYDMGYSASDDLPISGNCPMGFTGEWLLEAATAVCLETGSFDTSDMQIWIASTSYVREGLSEIIGFEFIDDQPDLVPDGEISAMCLSHNSIGSWCAAIWDGGPVKVAYVSGPKLNHDIESAIGKLRSELERVLRGIAEWDPALSIGGS
jgi:hypothetical protein